MKYCILFLLILLSAPSFGQGNDEQLAQAYYSRQEYEKAVVYSEKVYDRDPSKANFLRLYDCYIQTKEASDAEKLLKKQIKNYKHDFEYPVLLGQFYEDNNDPSKAQKVYEDLVND